jgi:hypothetical protein
MRVSKKRRTPWDAGYKFNPLAEELFRRIETEQGHAYISDGIESLTDYELIALTRGALEHAKRVVCILKEFLKEYEPMLHKKREVL